MAFRVASLGARLNDSSALARNLEELTLRTYPSAGLKDFVSDELADINRQLCNIFRSEIQALDRADGSDQPLLAARAVSLAGEVGRIVEAFSSADLKEHPLEIMLYLRDVVKVTDKARVEFITSPMREMNFSFREVWQPLRAALETDLGLKYPNKTRFVHFTFPTLHKDNPLLGAIYVHELGHYLDRRNCIWERIFARASRHRNIRRIQQQISTGGTPISLPRLLYYLKVRILGPWIREIVADTIGIHLLGPAFQLAAEEVDMFTVSESYPKMIDFIGVSHPSSALRCSHRHNLLKKFGHFDACPDEIQTRLDAIVEWWTRAPRECDNEVPKIVFDLAEEILVDMIKHIESSVDRMLPGEVRLSVSDLTDVVPGLVSRISLLIPPNELDGKPASPGAILNAGWAVYHTKLNEIRARIKGYDSEDKQYQLVEELHGLIRYALHASRVSRRWSEIDSTI